MRKLTFLYNRRAIIIHMNSYELHFFLVSHAVINLFFYLTFCFIQQFNKLTQSFSFSDYFTLLYYLWKASITYLASDIIQFVSSYIELSLYLLYLFLTFRTHTNKECVSSDSHRTGSHVFFVLFPFLFFCFFVFRTVLCYNSNSSFEGRRKQIKIN